MPLGHKLLDWLYEMSVVGSYSRLGYQHRSPSFELLRNNDELSEKTFIVTGANSGIGLAATRQLLEFGAGVIMACRSFERSFQVYADLVDEFPEANLTLRPVDISDLHNVDAFCDWLEVEGGAIDGVIHNAGALLDSYEKTDLGFECTLATHVLGPFLMTLRLKQLLSNENPGRVVFVSSGGMYTQRLDLNHLVNPPTPFDGVRAYAQAKRAQIVLTELLAGYFKGTGITINAMHPGWADTPGVETALPRFYRTLKGVLRSPHEGADTAVWLCLAPEARAYNGQLFLDRQSRKTHVFPWTRRSENYRERLWPLLLDLLGETGLVPAAAKAHRCN